MNSRFKEMLVVGRNNEDYYEDYISIINSAKIRGLDKSRINIYTEAHHIVPRCLGGDDSKENLVLLSFEEHLVAHLLLCYSNKDNLSLSCAAMAMLNLKNSSRNELIDPHLVEEYIDISVKIKEIYIKNKSIAVVCYSRASFDVIKIYSSISKVSEDGFSSRHVRECVSSGLGKDGYPVKSVNGYRFLKLEDFEKDHQNELQEYYEKLEQGVLPTIVPIEYDPRFHPSFNGEVIALDDFRDVVECFSSVSEAGRVLGISNPSICSAIRRGTKLHGIYLIWRKSIEGEAKPNKRLSNILNRYKTGHLVVRFNLESFTPIKIYGSSKEIEDDGYCYRQVQDVISKRINKYQKSKSGWASFKDYLIQFPEHTSELKEIYYN